VNLLKTRGDHSGAFEHFILVALLAFIAGLFIHNSLLWRWDNLLYDAQLSFWTRTVSDEIIIVAIDDESLRELGRWPWSRSTHASLIDKLELESPRAIGLDIIFSEPDANNPEADELLARALRASGKVVLPVFMSQKSNNSFPIEALPLPELAGSAAALGHVHLDISADGIESRYCRTTGAVFVNAVVSRIPLPDTVRRPTGAFSTNRLFASHVRAIFTGAVSGQNSIDRNHCTGHE
jgi:CHASE2 domain-containing sensor protein